jgi:bacterial leucyl aminopeptidase
MKHLKRQILLFYILILGGLILFTGSCKKDEESAQQRKAALIQKLNDQINADTLESIVSWMEDMGTRFALSDNHRNVAINILKRFKMVGYEEAMIDSFLINSLFMNVNYHQWQYNVVATLKGNSYPDSVYIIGSHYDNNLKTGDPFSVVPGANDNAGGVAATLELARVMKKNKYSPRNTIEFIAFGAEELGLYGSYAYSQNAKQTSMKIGLMLNNDMIAYQPGNNISEWAANIIDYDNSHKLRMEAEQMCLRYSELKYKNDNTYFKQSDSYPFFLNGYKALFFTSNYSDPNYHTTDDVTGYCNFNYCREICKICCSMLVDKN